MFPSLAGGCRQFYTLLPRLLSLQVALVAPSSSSTGWAACTDHPGHRDPLLALGPLEDVCTLRCRNLPPRFKGTEHPHRPAMCHLVSGGGCSTRCSLGLHPAQSWTGAPKCEDLERPTDPSNRPTNLHPTPATSCTRASGSASSTAPRPGATRAVRLPLKAGRIPPVIRAVAVLGAHGVRCS